MSEFQSKFSFEKRKNESERIKTKFPDRIPCILETNNKKIKMDKKKFLIHDNMTIGNLYNYIKKRINIDSKKAIFMYINNNILISSSIMKDIYNSYKNEDGFLYITYEMENTFG